MREKRRKIHLRTATGYAACRGVWAMEKTDELAQVTCETCRVIVATIDDRAASPKKKVASEGGQWARAQS